MGWGTYYRCFFLAKYLVRLGHEVRLICISGKKLDLGVSVQRVDGVEIVTIPRLRVKGEQFLQASFEITLSFTKKCDIIHGFSVSQPSTGIPVILSKALRRKPVLADWDDYWKYLLRLRRRTVNWIIDSFEVGVPRMANGVTVVSDFLLGKAKEAGVLESKIHKITNGADVDGIKPMNKENARKTLNLDRSCPLMLCVGRSFLKKTLEVLSKVRKKIPEAKMLVVGAEYVSPLARQTYEELKDNVIVVGRQPSEMIPHYLAAADVLVLPMENTPHEMARWPIRLGDYLASGRPIISNAVGDVKKILEGDKCGLTCPPDDIELFSEIAVKILNNSELGKKLGERSRKVAEEKYSWKVVTAKLDSLYNELIERRG